MTHKYHLLFSARHLVPLITAGEYSQGNDKVIGHESANRKNVIFELVEHPERATFYSSLSVIHSIISAGTENSTDSKQAFRPDV